MRRVALLLAIVMAAGACADDAAGSGTTSTSPTTSVATSTIPPPSTSLPPSTGPVDPLPRIPVGPGGLEYRGGDEMEITGPSGIAVGPAGDVHVVDPIANRILSFWPDGTTSEIDLAAIDVLSAPFVAAASDHLVVVEIFFGPVRERVHRIGYDGSVMASYQLPIAGRLQSGLAGVTVDGEDRIHLVIEAGVEFLRLDDASLEFESLAGFTKHGVTVTKQGVDVLVDGVLAAADLIGDFGGLRVLDVAANGTVVLVREDVVSTSPVEVIVSVEWWSPAGEFLGSAPVDLAAQAIDLAPGLAVGPGGIVLALYAREEAVEVVALERSAERFGR